MAVLSNLLVILLVSIPVVGASSLAAAGSTRQVIWMSDIQGPTSIPPGSTRKDTVEVFYGLNFANRDFDFLVKDSDTNKDDTLQGLHVKGVPVAPGDPLHKGKIEFELYCSGGKVKSKGPWNGKWNTTTGEREAEIYVQHKHHWSWNAWHGHRTNTRKIRCQK